MARSLLISGSPRRGNTEFVMRTLHGILGSNSELVLLRELDLKHCTGCLSCEGTGKCPIKDGMQELYVKMEMADAIVIGTPNYFDNVPGLLKDFIDRTNTFYNSGKLKGKKAFFIVVGGGDAGDSGRVISQALSYFAKGNGLNVAGSFIFKATKKDELSEDSKSRERIEQVSKKISAL